MLSEQDKVDLIKKAEFAGAVRRWASDPVFQEFQRQVDAISGKAHQTWALQTNPTEAEQLRQQIKGYYLFFGLVSKALMEGDNAQRLLKEESESEVSSLPITGE